MQFLFVHSAAYPEQAYEGALITVEIYIGFSAGGPLAWGVFVLIVDPTPCALAGEYVGATAATRIVAVSAGNSSPADEVAYRAAAKRCVRL